MTCVGLLMLAGIAAPSAVRAETPDGAYTLGLDGRSVTLYLPEVDSANGDSVTARSAVSVVRSGKMPVFGAARFNAVATRHKKEVSLSKIFIEEIKLPKSTEDAARLTAELNRSLEGAEWQIPAAQFDARLSPGVQGNKEDFEDDAPKVFYEERPAVLVWIDGAPIYKAAKNKRYKTVVNTAYFIVEDTEENAFFLKGGKWWYRSEGLKKEFIVTAAPSEEIRDLAAAAFSGNDNEADRQISDLPNPPKIVVSFEPAELVVVDGAPNYVSVEGTSLLYVDNTESNLLVDVNSQQFFLLLSGRWYASVSLKGPWKYVPPARLPADFAKIPDASDAADVRASVPGTPEASEAALAAAVPEVAAVRRNGTTVSVSYDGTPKFQPIDGTSVYYALNASTTVLKISGRFYAVDNGIWFEAPGPSGPWMVAAAVPYEVQKIPPSAPVYYVRYVYVYDYTPDVVYVGYTPGYYCSYVYHGAVVYGTGYYYRPWWRTVYRPHPVTFGFGAHYNPYTGWWGYPVGVTFGWISFGWYAAPLGFWGPAGYLYGYRHGYYHHHRHGYYHGVRGGYRDGYTAGRAAGYRASAGGRPVRGTVYAKQPQLKPVSGIRRDFAKPKSRPGTYASSRAGNAAPARLTPASRGAESAVRRNRDKFRQSGGASSVSRSNAQQDYRSPKYRRSAAGGSSQSGNMFHKNNAKTRNADSVRPQTGAQRPSSHSPTRTSPTRTPQKSGSTTTYKRPSYKSATKGSGAPVDSSKSKSSSDSKKDSSKSSSSSSFKSRTPQPSSFKRNGSSSLKPSRSSGSSKSSPLPSGRKKKK